MSDRPSPQEVVGYYSGLTGISFRAGVALPYDVGRQAVVFAQHFELWEMRLVVEWTLSMIRAAENGKERNGFSRLSLQWHRLIGERGDEALTQFQQRLGLATEWARHKRRDLLKPLDVPASVTPVAKPAPAPEPTDEEREQRLGRLAAQFAALKEQLAGLDPEEVERLKSANPPERKALPSG